VIEELEQIIRNKSVHVLRTERSADIAQQARRLEGRITKGHVSGSLHLGDEARLIWVVGANGGPGTVALSSHLRESLATAGLGGISWRRGVVAIGLAQKDQERPADTLLLNVPEWIAVHVSTRSEQRMR